MCHCVGIRAKDAELASHSTCKWVIFSVLEIKFLVKSSMKQYSAVVFLLFWCWIWFLICCFCLSDCRETRSNKMLRPLPPDGSKVVWSLLCKAPTVKSHCRGEQKTEKKVTSDPSERFGMKQTMPHSVNTTQDTLGFMFKDVLWKVNAL